MDIELQATCSALGYLEGNQYVKEPDCLETVKDLIRFLRHDTDLCDIRRQLGHAQIVTKDLIPLLKTYHTDAVLFETTIKLLVNLTQPVVSAFNNQIPDEKTLRNNCLEVESHLQDAKEGFYDEDLFKVLAEKVTQLLQQEWDDRREEDKLQLERLFMLIRNVLLIPSDPDREQRTDDDATIHDQILWAIHKSGMEDLLLYIASSDRERSLLCMHIMEIVSLMFKEQCPETLASAGVQRSTTEKDRDQKQLEQAREKERAKKKASILKFSARHSRFGGTFVIQDRLSITDSNVIYHKPLCEVKEFSYDTTKKRKKQGKNFAPIKAEDRVTRRSTLSMRLILKEFCKQFLVNAYNPLMRAVKDGLTRNSTQDHDETYYLWAMRFFMEFARLACKRVDLVSETMSMNSFHWIYTQLTSYYESFLMEKGEERKTWGRRSHLALKAYQELLKTLEFMGRCPDAQIRESAKVIQSNVFYMIEYRDIFVTLLKKFKDGRNSRPYLKDLIESTHIFLKLLENFTKGNKNLVVQKKSKKRKKKKTRQNTENTEPQREMTEEELLPLWETDVSTTLTQALEGTVDLPLDVQPFDATADTSVDDQRVDTMVRIQTHLREGQSADALALFRASREVWPERDEFGSEGMGQEEEYEALKEVFMASLPRRQSQLAHEFEEEEEENEVEQEEMAPIDTAEATFNFRQFITDFANPFIIKNYCLLLEDYQENTDATNHCIIKMLHRLAQDLGYVGMLFQASLFRIFFTLLHGPLAKLPRFKEISKFGLFVVRQFTALAQSNKKLFVDLLFWKTKGEAIAIMGDYDFASKRSGKIVWTEHDEQEVTSLYFKYRHANDPELDTIQLMMADMTSDHTRLQIIKLLKSQEHITSARDIKKPKGAGKGVAIWSEDDLQTLIDAVDIHKNSDDPISGIMNSMDGRDKSKRSVIKKCLELDLVADREELKKKKKGRGPRRRRGGSDEEGDVRRRGGSDSDSSSDEADDDDTIQNLVGLATSSVGDYVSRLVENGYRDQIAWIQRGLRNTAEDREEGVCVATPIVPLNEENETAMEDEVFLVFLKSIGVTPPTNEQEMFWRIPAELSPTDLKVMADGLSVGDGGQAADPEAVTAIVARVFPRLGAGQWAGDAANRAKKDKGKKKKKKKKTERKERPARQASGSDSGSESDSAPMKKEKFIPQFSSRPRDSDTSDSGLDLDIEAREQEKLWRDRKKGGKSGARLEMLTNMVKRKNEKRSRTDRSKRGAAGPSTEETGAVIEDVNVPTAEDAGEGSGRQEGAAGTSPSGEHKKKGKRVTMLASDSESDIEDTPPVSNRLGVSQPENDDDADADLPSSLGSRSPSPSPVKVKASKRALESDSDSDIGNTSLAKRSRLLQSDEEDDGDKENLQSQSSLNQSQGESQSQQDDSLKLHFDTSDEEGEGEGSPLKDYTPSDPKKQSGDSFPATMYTQGLDSDDSDNDHVPLRAVLNKKRRVIIDDSDE